jgi:hypothetical protein
VAALRYNPAKVTEYRDSAVKLHALRREVQRQLDSAVESGDKQAARDALAELKASGAAFKELRTTLSPTDLFIAKYNIQVHGSHEVSFVLPQGVSRYEMLCEAQGLVAERESGRDLVWPGVLKTTWKEDKTFQATSTTPERIQIDGHVKGGDGKTRADQEEFLKRKGLPQANLEDLAAAFVAHWVATGEPLFGWYKKFDQWTFTVRAAGGALYFFSNGLVVNVIVGDSSSINVAVASRVPRPRLPSPPEATADKPESKN